MPLQTRVCPWYNVLVGGAHWHHLTNTNEQAVRGGEVALYKNYADHLFHFWVAVVIQITQEVLLPQTDRATRCVSQHFANCFTNCVSK